jgi:hypothetical protein
MVLTSGGEGTASIELMDGATGGPQRMVSMGDDADLRTPWQVAAGEELDAARARLDLHRVDRDAGVCRACGHDSPCPASQNAGRVLVEAGAWNLPPLRPGGHARHRQPGRHRPAALGRWLSRIVRLISNRLHL